MLECMVILLCLVVNAFLSGAEAAFISISRPDVRELVKQGNKEARNLLRMRENPERALSVIQVGITFVGTFAAAIGGAGAEETIAPWLQDMFDLSDSISEVVSISMIVIPLTYISVVLGELVPKALALRAPLPFSMLASPILTLIERFIRPVVTVLELSTKKIIANLPCCLPSKQFSNTHVDKSSVLEGISLSNRKYVLNLLQVERTRVKDILVVWDNVIRISRDSTVSDIEKIIFSSGHTRLPICDGKSVVGILHTKEFLAFQKMGKGEWLSLMRPFVSLHQEIPLLTALRMLQKEHSHIGIVVNGEQKEVGIVTIEDILEEIIGDLYDEDDDERVRHILSTSTFLR